MGNSPYAGSNHQPTNVLGVYHARIITHSNTNTMHFHTTHRDWNSAYAGIMDALRLLNHQDIHLEEIRKTGYTEFTYQEKSAQAHITYEPNAVRKVSITMKNPPQIEVQTIDHLAISDIYESIVRLINSYFQPTDAAEIISQVDPKIGLKTGWLHFTPKYALHVIIESDSK